MTQNKPLILVSNDDGVDAKGIHALVDMLAEYGDIVVVAPEAPQSGKSSSLTLNLPLRHTQLPDYNGAKMYRVNGTPVDCVKLAIDSILEKQPDFIVAGINHGANSAVNTIYSGTMGIVFEGCILGIPSVGFSLLSHSPNADFSVCNEVVKTVMSNVVENGLPTGICLNVNIPKEAPVKGIKATKAATGYWTNEFERRTDPYHRDYYWMRGEFINEIPDDDTTDVYWLDRGYATLTPCHPDQTAHYFMQDAEFYTTLDEEK